MRAHRGPFRLIALSASDWRLLVGACVLEITVFTAMRVLPLTSIRRMAMTPGWLARTCVRLALGGRDERRTVWAIEAAGRRLGPAGRCLVRAIVGALALASDARALRLYIGIRHGEDGALESHAWLSDGARVLVGGSESSAQFEPLVAWQGFSS